MVTGRSGSGKSTLVNCINGIIPHMVTGELAGEVRVMGEPVASTPLSRLSTLVGTVLQDPDSQVINYLVEEEVSFGPENLMVEPSEIARRVEDAMAVAGISHLRGRETSTLSGGELQRVVLASVLAMKPEILILDEPTSNIDPEGTEAIFSTLVSLKGKKTLIIIEHKVERVLPFVDRVILIDNHTVALDLRREEILMGVDRLHEAGIEVPAHMLYAKRLGLGVLDFHTVRKAMSERGIELPAPQRVASHQMVLESKITVRAGGRTLVDGLELTLGGGEVVSVMGRNGAGKTTAFKALAGLLDKDFQVSGHIKVFGEELSGKPVSYRGKYMVYMPQTFDLMLVSSRVQDEVTYSARKRGLKGYGQKAQEIMREFGLYDHRDDDPVTLSMGERRRVVMASIIASGARILLMDEPTSGQDHYNKLLLGQEIRGLAKKGYTVGVITHDSAFTYRFADRVVLMEQGRAVLNGKPEEVFHNSENYGIIPPSDYLLRCA